MKTYEAIAALEALNKTVADHARAKAAIESAAA